MLYSRFILGLAGMASAGELRPFKKPSTLATRSGDLISARTLFGRQSCPVGQSTCDNDYCIDAEDLCCYEGYGFHCDDGYYCDIDGCCLIGETCDSSLDPTDCDADQERCGNFCMPKDHSCCNEDIGYSCWPGDVCTVDLLFCLPPDDAENWNENYPGANSEDSGDAQTGGGCSPSKLKRDPRRGGDGGGSGGGSDGGGSDGGGDEDDGCSNGAGSLSIPGLLVGAVAVVPLLV